MCWEFGGLRGIGEFLLGLLFVSGTGGWGGTQGCDARRGVANPVVDRHFALAEAGVLLLAEYAGSETMRRFVVSVVVLALWVIGWAATPASTKRWAWEHVKVYLFVLILDELRNVARQGLGGGGGRRRRARW